jgi:hypothetical protein
MVPLQVWLQQLAQTKWYLYRSEYSTLAQTKWYPTHFGFEESQLYCNFFFYFDQTWAMASWFMRFLYHKQQCTTGSRTPLNEWSAHQREFYLTTHNTHKKRTSMPSPSGIWTSNLSRQAPTDPRVRPRGHWLAWHCNTFPIYSINMYRCTYSSFRAFQIFNYLMWIIWTATDNPLSHPITPSCTRESPIAAKPTRRTTRHQILCWKVEVHCAIWVHTNPVWHRFHCTKCLEDTQTFKH